MKVKITFKKLFLLAAIVAVLCTVMCLSFTAGAVDCDHENLDENGWIVEVAATCRESAVVVQRCPDCFEMQRKHDGDIDPTNHIPGLWTVVEAHSCEKPGREVIYCVNGCRDKYGSLIELESREIPQHDYSVLFKQEPTCQQDGYEFIACMSCYDMQTKTLERDPDAHKFTEWIVTTEATCVNESGERTRYCLNYDGNGNPCSEVDTENYSDPNNHTNIVWDESTRKKATCYVPGSISGTCDGCDKVLKKEIPVHTDSDSKEISRVPSTCHNHGTKTMLCECGYTYDEELPLDTKNHVYREWKVVKEPLCQAGLREQKCKYLCEDAKRTQIIPATGEHVMGEWVVTDEPKCSKTGSKTRACTVEGCKYTETETLPAHHEYGTWTVIEQVSCNEATFNIGRKLAKCDNCNVEKYFTVPAVHTYGSWKTVRVASCRDGKAGLKERTCSGCGKKETMEYYQEHDYTDWYVVDKPVCATDKIPGKEGICRRWCKTCHTNEKKAIGVNHEYTDWVITEYPVCYADGSIDNGKKEASCKFCDKKITETIKGEHIFGEWKTVSGTGACGTEIKQERICFTCGCKEDKNIKVEHVFGNWYCDDFDCDSGEVKAPNTLTRKCTKCDVTEKNKSEITLNHPNIKTITFAATCTESGYTQNYCPNCGYTEYVGDIIPPLGHELDKNWTVKVQATCNTPGSHYKACARCDYLEFEYLAGTKHILIQIEPGVDPTCTESGYSSHSYCGVCKAVFPSQVLEPLGHHVPEGSETCIRCNAYKGTDCACACHSTSGMESIIFKLMNKINQLFGLNQTCGCGILHYDEPGFFAKLFGKG